jgi:hypothetical protein
MSVELEELSFAVKGGTLAVRAALLFQYHLSERAGDHGACPNITVVAKPG